MFTGSIVAIVTPMDAMGDLDGEALDRLVEWHIESGTHGIVPVGTTGESATLSVAEHNRVVERVVRAVDGRVPVIAGTGANSTTEALEMTRAARSAGADASLQVTPYYNRPTQEGLYRHYATIAEDVDIPIVLYNVPARTGVDLLAETVARLAPIDNVVGIKDASTKVERVGEILSLCGDGFTVLSGEDGQNLDLMRAGAKGVISVTANVDPVRMSAFCTAALAGDDAEAERLHNELAPLHKALFCETSPIPSKWALEQMGRIGPGIRLPLTPLSEDCHDVVRAALREAGIEFE